MSEPRLEDVRRVESPRYVTPAISHLNGSLGTSAPTPFLSRSHHGVRQGLAVVSHLTPRNDPHIYFLTWLIWWLTWSIVGQWPQTVSKGTIPTEGKIPRNLPYLLPISHKRLMIYCRHPAVWLGGRHGHEYVLKKYSALMFPCLISYNYIWCQSSLTDGGSLTAIADEMSFPLWICLIVQLEFDSDLAYYENCIFGWIWWISIGQHLMTESQTLNKV